MLTVISPAKTLDFETPPQTDQATQPSFLKDSKQLIEGLRQLSEPAIAELMSISPKLAALNAQRYRDWKTPFKKANAKQALLAFKGDVYTGFELGRYTDDDFAFAQEHLRILSGLHGLLRPLDLIQPYRLEMGTKFENARGKDLYAFWQQTVTRELAKALEASGNSVLVNLASNEYFGAVNARALDAEIVTPVFHDEKDGKYKVISFFAKKARGAMSDFMIRQRVNDPEGLKAFRGLGYRWSKQDSRGNTWVFTRAEKDRPA